ncbi:hypothetical protein PSACC_03044 [Paramicrosporidium saccamoebae]|uniref:Uncharacterized protein n=1 Tax=Paramicrosporidium saccamoebae TaxID=1246581 RepID=A0A2H9TH99_9FUNG|nr:hypothetical protein PSACC_03044 [Paramicrosporidium saccamoebae]
MHAFIALQFLTFLFWGVLSSPLPQLSSPDDSVEDESSSIGDIRGDMAALTLNTDARVTAQIQSPISQYARYEKQKLRKLARAVRAKLEARYPKCLRGLWTFDGVSLGLPALERALHEAIVKKGVEPMCACEMLGSSAAWSLGPSELFQQSLTNGYQNVLKCLLAIPLRRWESPFMAHLFVALSYKSDWYDSDLWHALWVNSYFGIYMDALYASGNALLFEILPRLPRRDSTSLRKLCPGLFWTFFGVVARHDAVGTIKYLTDQLDLSAICEKKAELIDYDAIKIIDFLCSKDASFKSSMATVERLERDEHLNTDHLSNEHLNTDHLSNENLGADHLSIEHLGAEHLSIEHPSAEQLNIVNPSAEQLSTENSFTEHLITERLITKHLITRHLVTKHSSTENPTTEQSINIPSIAKQQTTLAQHADVDYIKNYELWKLALVTSTRIIIERMKKCDKSYKTKHNQARPLTLDALVGAELEKGTDALCLLDMIRGNVNFQLTPSILLSSSYLARYFNIFFCIQAFSLSSFENQAVAHSYIATIYKTSCYDQDLWMRLWLSSRFDQHQEIIYATLNVKFLTDLHQLPRNPEIILPAHTAERFFEVLSSVAISDALKFLKYFESNYGLDLTKVAKHLDTFITNGARKIVEYLVTQDCVKLGPDEVRLAIHNDKVNIVALAVQFGHVLSEEDFIQALTSRSPDCAGFFSEYFKSPKP